MGQQQLLLIILGVIIVGIAIAVGISQFGAHSTQANKDGVTASLVNGTALRALGWSAAEISRAQREQEPLQPDEVVVVEDGR